MQRARVLVKKNGADVAMRDLRRDWDGWSIWERRFAMALAALSFAASIFWLGMSLGMLF